MVANRENDAKKKLSKFFTRYNQEVPHNIIDLLQVSYFLLCLITSLVGGRLKGHNHPYKNQASLRQCDEDIMYATHQSP